MMTCQYRSREHLDNSFGSSKSAERSSLPSGERNFGCPLSMKLFFQGEQGNLESRPHPFIIHLPGCSLYMVPIGFKSVK